MYLGVAHVDKEGLFLRRVSFDVLDGFWDDVLPIDDRPHLEIKRHHWLGRFALFPFPDHGGGDTALLEEPPLRRACLVTAVRNTPPLVEALVIWKPPLDVAQMPLAVQRGGIACLGKKFA